MSVVMYGLGVSAPEIPWENPWERERRMQREEIERQMREAMERAAISTGLGQLMPQRGATIGELDALTKRVEAIEQQLRERMKPKRKRRTKR